jgi:hypothetical protein
VARELIYRRNLSMVANGNDVANEYFRTLIEWETEGEITPAQTEPHEAVMDMYTPALLRKQAA